MINEKLKSGVYILFDEQRELYKIGRSKDVKKRIKQVQASCNFSGIKSELQVFNIIYVKNYKTLEKHLHMYANKYKYKNEWFKCLDEENINNILMKIDLSYYNK